MRTCQAKGCTSLLVEPVRTKQGTFDVCSEHRELLASADEVGDPPAPVAIVAERAMFVSPVQKPTGRPPIALSAEAKAEIAARREAGETVKSIATGLGLDHSTLKRRLNAGLEDAPEPKPSREGLAGLAERYVVAGKRLAEGAAKVKEGERILREAKATLRQLQIEMDE